MSAVRTSVVGAVLGTVADAYLYAAVAGPAGPRTPSSPGRSAPALADAVPSPPAVVVTVTARPKATTGRH